MPDVNLFFREGYQKRNGECAIYLIVHLDYKSLKFNSGVSCAPKDWDKKRMRVKGASVNSKDKNLIIEQLLARMNDIFVRYRLQNVVITPDLLANEWKNPARRIDFHAFADEAMLERKKELAANTYKSHKSILNKLKNWKPKLAFSEINPDFIEQYRRKLKLKNDINTVHANLKVIKAYLQIAVRKGIIAENPFTHVRMLQAKTTRVYLTEEELKSMWTYYEQGQLSNTWRKVLRHFLFMCFTGLRVSDLRLVKQSDVHAGLLFFSAQKTRHVTKDVITIPLNSYAQRLIKDEACPDDRLFMTMTEQRMNVYLKEIVAELKLHKEVTNHTGRHTFATLFLKKTKDLAVLQKLLGHARITETMQYVHITQEDIRTQMSQMDTDLFQ